MSLFKTRDWWSTRCGEGEEFDRGCLCVGNVDNEPNNASGDKIVVGSFSGRLRIFHPKQRHFTAADLLLEMQLSEPILQVELGKFVPGSQELALGVLMPRKFVVFTVESTERRESLVGSMHNEGDDDQSDQIQTEKFEEDKSRQLDQYLFTKQYEHRLDRISVNFCFGSFGGIYGKDYICIQSFDGQLSFYEQDHFVFSRFLSSKYLTSGPLCYSKTIDCFITYNNCMELECFRYQNLAASTGSIEKEREETAGQQMGTAGKKVQPDWSIVLGEEVYDICVARYSQFCSGQNEIIVLGEKTMFVVKENGILISQRRFDYYPSCFYAYNTSRDSLAKQNLMIGTQSSTISILKDPKTIWSAKLHSVPIALRTGVFGGVLGMVVTLDDSGELCVSYMGTDPSFSNMSGLTSSSDSASERQEFDYMKAEEEHRRLKQMIRQMMRIGKREPKEGLMIKTSSPVVTISTVYDRKIVNFNLILSYSDQNSILEDVSVRFVIPDPFELLSNESMFFIRSINGGSQTPLALPLSVGVNNKKSKAAIVTSLTAQVYVTYTMARIRPNDTKGNDNPKYRRSQLQRTQTMEFTIPLTMAGHIVSNKKVDTYKITLETNKPTPSLFDLFEDIIYNEKNSEHIQTDNRSLVLSGNVMTFRYTNGQEATVLISKNTSRYRIQGGDFDALWIMTSELSRRLEKYHNKELQSNEVNKEDQLRIRLSDKLPYNSLFSMIDRHFEIRVELKKLNDELRNRSHQLRSIQKRLLLRFMDRNPAPLNNLDLLVEHTYQSILQVSQDVELKQLEMQQISMRLSNAVSLFTLLVKFDLHMKPDDYSLLCQFLSPDVSSFSDPEEQGWEEITDASMTHLLRTALSKSARERESVPQPIDFPKDTSRVKKHIAIVIDRLSKGGSLEGVRDSTSEGSEQVPEKHSQKSTRTSKKQMLLG